MSNKMECPACGSETSLIGTRYQEGRPCPYCGLPAETAAAIMEARERGANAKLTEKIAQAEVRASKAEREATWLRDKLERIQRILNEKQPDLKDEW